MSESTLTTPPFSWIRETLGIDGISDPPIIMHTRRIRGRLRHTTLERLPEGSSIPTIGCMANTESVVRRLEAPYSASGKARRVFPALLDLRLPFPETECERVFLDMHPASGGGQETLAVAARRSAIRSRLAAYAAIGSDPLAIDQEGLAIWTQSMLEHEPATDPQAETVQVVIFLRSSHATLCIGRNARLLSTGNLSENIVPDMDRRLKALDVATEHPLDVRWAGSGATNTETLDACKEAFQRLRPAARQITHKTPETMLARALTTRAMTDGAYRCNLRTGELTHGALHRRRQRHTLCKASVTALTGLGLLAIGLAWHAGSRQHADRMRHHVHHHAEQIIGRPTALRGDDAVAEARRHVEEVRRQTQAFAALIAADTGTAMERMITLAQHHDIMIHGLELEHDALVRLDGSAQTWDTVTAFASDLSPYFGALSPQRAWDAEPDGEALRFFIEPQP